MENDDKCRSPRPSVTVSPACLHGFTSIQRSPIHLPDRYVGQIDALQAPCIDGPSVERQHPLGDFLRRCGPGLAERHDPAGRAEIVPGGAGVPFVHAQVLQRREHPQRGEGHAVDQCAAAPAHGAVAAPDVVEDGLDFEAAGAAVA